MVQLDPKKHSPLQVTIILSVLVLIAMIVAFFITIQKDKRAQEALFEEQARQTRIEQFEDAFNSGDLERAIVQGELLLDAYPDDITSYLFLASAHVQLGSVQFFETANTEKAIELLQQALRINPLHSEIFRLLGFAYEIQSLYEESEASYSYAIELDATNSRNFSSRGHLYFLIGKYTEAESDYTKALQLDDQNVEALINLANLYLKTEQTDADSIEEILLRAIALSTNNFVSAEALHVLGDLYFSQGNYIAALTQFYDALEYNDASIEALLGVAFSELMLLENVTSDVEFDASVQTITEHIEQALSHNKNLARAYIAKGMLLNARGAFTLEKPLYQDALRVLPNDSTLSILEKNKLRTEIYTLLEEI